MKRTITYYDSLLDPSEEYVEVLAFIFFPNGRVRISSAAPLDVLPHNFSVQNFVVMFDFIPQMILSYLEKDHMDKKGIPLDIQSWKKIPKAEKQTRQVGGVDCGVFVCMNARLVCEGKSCCFTTNMSVLRQVMLLELLSGELRELPLKEAIQEVRNIISLVREALNYASIAISLRTLLFLQFVFTHDPRHTYGFQN